MSVAEARRTHWSFRPVSSVTLPVVRDAAWSANAIDRFVLAKLEAAGLTPSPDADRITLLRRATFDLTGLPPTPEEIDAFGSDHAPDAWEKVVDRLLASPSYGERWGRHWLDVARYADTKGYVFTDSSPIPGMTLEDFGRIAAPAMIFRGSPVDIFHPEHICERVAELLPRGELADAPWEGDIFAEHMRSDGRFFDDWHQAAPAICDFLDRTS